MTLPSVRPDPPEANQHGYIPRYVSPHGHLAGLRERLGRWVDRMGRDRSLPWVGLGLVNDLEVVLQLLNMREYAEWLRTNGDPAHARFADEIIDAQDALAVAGYQGPSLGENVDGLDNENRENEKQALVLDDMRKVLVEYGALAPDDRATPLPDLLRALLS